MFPLMLGKTKRNKPASYNTHSKTHPSRPEDLQQAPQSEAPHYLPTALPWGLSLEHMVIEGTFNILILAANTPYQVFEVFSRGIQPGLLAS